MSDRKVRSRLPQLLLLICLGLLPAEVISNFIPNPCQNGQVYANGGCSPIIVNVFNGCGGQTGIACNTANPVVDPSTPGCPNAPLQPIVDPATPGCPNTPLKPIVYPAAPEKPKVDPANPACPNAPLPPTVDPVTTEKPKEDPANPACPNAPLKPVVDPATPACPNAPLKPIVDPVTPGCPNTPLNPSVVPPSCPNNCPSSCPNSCNNNCSSNCPNNSSNPGAPCPTLPPSNSTPQPDPAPQPTPAPQPAPPLHSTPRPGPVPDPILPPAPIIRCPEGTILVRGVCRLIFCGRYEVYNEGRCTQARCPAGYVWTGIRCSKPKPVEIGNIHIENYVHQAAGNLPHLVTNNVNNVEVNASIAIEGQASEEEEDEVEDVVVPNPPSGPCCNVFAPRICSTQVDQVAYKCFSRSQQQCGAFCSANKVVLAPQNVTTWTQANNQMVVIPPNWAGQGCQSNGGICQQAQNFYDCSGCALGDFSTCSSYCYSYKCSTHNCAFYDQTQYCSLYPGQIGCRAVDGWFPVS
ncbi:keratinocyte proline-rich protein [Drosophila biarmipes]|uniref:keratinocyte proline-rich protein n=1 Tax=Drosophila biarmipes TaxID=125945 RepID=UPI0007E72BD3|nr:keratinocyte proline-rich protein [Drosophila biarmipes]